MRTIESLPEIQTFVAVASAKSFTGAARALGVSKAYVSQQLRALERRLGVALVHRTTRRMILTDVGAQFLARARGALAELDDAEEAARQFGSTPRGHLRVSAPVSFGERFLSRAVAKFIEEHPEVSVSLSLDDRQVDLIDEGYDVAVRIASLPDSSLIARKLANSRNIVCASPTYLKTRGLPRTPKGLTRHECLLYDHQTAGNTWSFENGHRSVSVKVQGRTRANNGDALATFAQAGCGVALLPEFLIRDQLANGTLVRLFPSWWARQAAIFALHPATRHPSPKVRAFIEHLVHACRELSA